MCWTEIKDNINVQIADRDFKVYKVVSDANKQSCKSIIMGFDYTVNTPYYIPTIEYKVFGFKYKVVNIKKAYHSYIGIHFICNSSFYNRAKYEEAGIKINFQKMILDEYPQKGNAFEPGLSILDVMMFNSAKKINSMLERYEII